MHITCKTLRLREQTQTINPCPLVAGKGEAGGYNPSLEHSYRTSYAGEGSTTGRKKNTDGELGQ